MSNFSSGSRDGFDENQQMHSMKNRMHSMKSQCFCVFSKAQDEESNGMDARLWHPCTAIVAMHTNDLKLVIYRTSTIFCEDVKKLSKHKILKISSNYRVSRLPGPSDLPC